MHKTNKTLATMTVREAGDVAHQMDMTLADWLAMIGPIPTAPAGYELEKTSSTRWIGPEKVGPRWIVTAIWDAATNAQTVEVFTATNVGEKYTNLTPAEALAMASDVAAVARTIAGAE